MAVNAGTVYSEMVLDMSKYEKNLEKAERQMKDFASKIEKAGQQMQKVGKSLTKKLSLPLAAAGTASAKFAGDFEESLNKVSTIADTTIKSTEELSQGLLDMSDDLGIAATELSETLYQTISATGDTGNALDYVEVAAKAAIGGFTDTTTAVDGLTTVMNSYGLKGTAAMQSVSDQMLMAQNFGKTTFGEMASSIGNVIPIASSLDISTQELFASIATLTKNGIQTSQAITGLKAAYSNILKPSKEASDLAAQLGLNFNAAELKSKGWASFLDQVKEKTGGNSEQMAKLFGSVEALNSVTVLATTGSEDFAAALGAMATSAGSTEKAFDTMEQGFNDSFADTLNSLKNLGIEIGQILIPMLTKGIEKVQQWVDWFKSLDQGTKETAVRIATLTAAIGPMLVVGGKLATGITAITGLFTKMSVASTAATAATGTMANSVGAAGLAAKAGALLLNPWTLGIAAATAGGIALVQHLRKDSIPTVNLYGEEVSSATQKAIGSFLELNDKATMALNQLSWSGQTVTNEMSDKITNSFSQMAQRVQSGLGEHHQESLSKIQGFVDGSTALSEEEQQQILTNMQQSYEDRKKEVSEAEARIQEIFKTASAEKRALTKEEQQEINSIQREMMETGIRVLSENELEAKAIMERMKAQAGEITAQQAAEVAQNSLRQKEDAVKAAKEQYDEVIKEIIRQRDAVGTISTEQADKLIEEATRQKDEAIAKATEMHNKVIEEAKLQAEEHVNKVSWETGEIKAKWQVMRDDLLRKAKDIKEDVSEKWEDIKKTTSEKWASVKKSVSDNIYGIKSKIAEGIAKIKEWNSTNVREKVFSIVEKVKNVVTTVQETVSRAIGNNAQGTNYWSGGLTWVGEQGPELIELPRGSKVYSNQKSMDMASNSQTAQRQIIVNLHVGTLVADDYGLKQLERKLNKIRIDESARLGVATE